MNTQGIRGNIQQDYAPQVTEAVTLTDLDEERGHPLGGVVVAGDTVDHTDRVDQPRDSVQHAHLQGSKGHNKVRMKVSRSDDLQGQRCVKQLSGIVYNIFSCVKKTP